MINLKEIYDLLSESFSMSDEVFHWGDNAIVQGSLENLPMPEFFQQISDGSYYALFDILNVNPKVEIEGLYNSAYHFSIILCRKGKGTDITKLRSDMTAGFLNGFAQFMDGQEVLYTVDNVFPRVNEIESAYNSIAVQIVGTISRLEESASSG
jgi:hypothetical protein